ncbi:hypothetical protein VTK73DRAFT_5037 [Phialemonium thermophilum]|uniref:Uncharacterized protein n=1 Tax=Phialemonium thermophilum TaxID=223376 RepID=A0ABR3V428_9PEZI
MCSTLRFSHPSVEADVITLGCVMRLLPNLTPRFFSLPAPSRLLSCIALDITVYLRPAISLHAYLQPESPSHARHATRRKWVGLMTAASVSCNQGGPTQTANDVMEETPERVHSPHQNWDSLTRSGHLTAEKETEWPSWLTPSAAAPRPLLVLLPSVIVMLCIV